ncbi:MAG: hypothetical protein ABII01_05665 [Candidatus Woesearchaeota archaeon]
MEQDEYMIGEYYLKYKGAEDCEDVLRGLIGLISQGAEYIPATIQTFRHVNYLHVRYHGEVNGIEQRLQEIEKVTKVERVPKTEIL